MAAQQGEDGSISRRLGIGPTASARWHSCGSAARRTIRRSPADSAFLDEATQENGGIYTSGSRIPTYETCIAMVCFKEANQDGKYDKILQAADKFVRGGQWDESEGKDRSDLYYGGAGYGGRRGPTCRTPPSWSMP